MAESLLASTMHALDRTSISRIAGSLRESEAPVFRCLEFSCAAILGGLATHCSEPGMLRRILDLAPVTRGGWSQLPGEISSPASPLGDGGKRILAALFPESERDLTSALSHDSGLGSWPAATLVALAAATVAGMVRKMVRDGDLSMTTLAATLRSEGGMIRNALPQRMSDLVWRRRDAQLHTPQVDARPVRRAPSSPWLGVVTVGAATLGFYWLITHERGGLSEIGSAATGAASRLATDAQALGTTLTRHIGNTVPLRVGGASGEARLLAFIQDTGAIPSGHTWFEFNTWRFDPGAAILRPDARDQLDDVAAIFKAYPQLRAVIAGFTDSTESKGRNMALSELRANTVVVQLRARGVPADRMTPEGRGASDAIDDDSSEAGRAANRRVALQVIEK